MLALWYAFWDLLDWAGSVVITPAPDPITGTPWNPITGTAWATINGSAWGAITGGQWDPITGTPWPVVMK